MTQKIINKPTTGIFISAKDSCGSLQQLVQFLDHLNQLCSDKFDIVLVDDSSSISDSSEYSDSSSVSVSSEHSDSSSVSVSSEAEKSPSLPKELDVPELCRMLQTLADNGILSADWQLCGQTWTERAEMVAFLSGKLRRRCMWSAFASLWHCDRNALKSAYAKHSDSHAAREYYLKLEKILE